MNYDIIGDIHGQADKPVNLLEKMGYTLHGNVWQHFSRQVIAASWTGRRVFTPAANPIKGGDKNRHQHKAFLHEVQHLPQKHKAIIDWFLTLPLWLDLPDIRIVHACWHPQFIDFIKPSLNADNSIPLSLTTARVMAVH